MTLTIYVAGSSNEILRVRRAMSIAMRLGYRLTHDWTTDVLAHGSNPMHLITFERRAIAARALEGVAAARVVWYLAAEVESIGACVELGAAIANPNVRVLISGSERARDRSIFFELAEWKGHDDDAYWPLSEWMRT